jgi:hypothetical protein
MATTTPDGIYYPISTTQIAPLETQFSTLATSVQTALTARKRMTVADTAALDALSEATYSGYVVNVTSNGTQWFSNGTKWLLANVPDVVSSAARDALYTGSVTVNQGDTVFRDDLGYNETYFALYNVSTNPGGKTTAGWYPPSGFVPSFPTVAARTAAMTTLAQGMQSYIRDSNTYWTYYAVYNASTNPGGASVAGWYPAEGTVLFAGKRNNTSLSLTNAAYTNITFNTFQCAGSTSNTDTIQISSATVPATMTVRVAGWYQMNMSTPLGAFSSTVGSTRSVVVNRNSTNATTGLLGITRDSTPSSGLAIFTAPAVLLAAGDVIRFWLYQDSGGTATNNDTNALITYLRPASV